jgi:hypothetical protein
MPFDGAGPPRFALAYIQAAVVDLEAPLAISAFRSTGVRRPFEQLIGGGIDLLTGRAGNIHLLSKIKSGLWTSGPFPASRFAASLPPKIPTASRSAAGSAAMGAIMARSIERVMASSELGSVLPA